MVTPATPTQFQPIPRNRAKLYEMIARQIERRILEHLHPGDALPSERELVRMFAVSRASIRDALRKLEVMGLVEPRQGVGTVVREPHTGTLSTQLTDVLLEKRKMIVELVDVRRLLEPALAARAAQHASAEQIAAMNEIVRRQQTRVRAGEPAVDEDSEFHYSIALAARNEVLLKLMDVLMGLLRKMRERSLQTPGRQTKSLAGHRRILRAVARGDAGGAEAAMQRHLAEIENIMLHQL
jgi:GntR family transcriptional regulator, transcriptional repressor for pyruvate dehydrogenase complex